MKKMVQVDLITGFLGAGKTTFLRRYVRYLVEQGHNVCILENDFGAVNVDAMLVQDLLGDRCDLETISGGCDCDTHQRRMRTKLIAMAMRGFDRVVVEPSGIFDVDEFFDVLRDDPLDRWYRIGNVIAIVDAMLPEALSPQAEYLLASETANAGRVLLSRAPQAGPDQCRAAIAHLDRAPASAPAALPRTRSSPGTGPPSPTPTLHRSPPAACGRPAAKSCTLMSTRPSAPCAFWNSTSRWSSCSRQLPGCSGTRPAGRCCGSRALPPPGTAGWS